MLLSASKIDIYLQSQVPYAAICEVVRRISAASSASARSARQIEAAGTPDWSTAEGGIPLKGDVTK